MESDIESIINQTLTHEKYVTKSLYAVHELACEVEDSLTKVFIHDYIKEQIEEEAVSQSLVDTYNLTSDMLLFDNRVKELI
jgi:ferritin